MQDSSSSFKSVRSQEEPIKVKCTLNPKAEEKKGEGKRAGELVHFAYSVTSEDNTLLQGQFLPFAFAQRKSIQLIDVTDSAMGEQPPNPRYLLS